MSKTPSDEEYDKKSPIIVSIYILFASLLIIVGIQLWNGTEFFHGKRYKVQNSVLLILALVDWLLNSMIMQFNDNKLLVRLEVSLVCQVYHERMHRRYFSCHEILHHHNHQIV